MKLPNSRKLKYPFRNYFTPSWKNNNLMTKNRFSPNSEIGGNFIKLKFENESQINRFHEFRKKNTYRNCLVQEWLQFLVLQLLVLD